MKTYTKAWGKELYFETLEETLQHIKVDFIREKVKKEGEYRLGNSLHGVREFGIQESESGYILCVFAVLKGETVYDLYNAETK